MAKIFLALAMMMSGSLAWAEETMSEKAASSARDAKRSVKKGGHRLAEAVCAEGDAKCLAKKAKHKAAEGSDYVKDKATDVKDKVDSE